MRTEFKKFISFFMISAMLMLIFADVHMHGVSADEESVLMSSEISVVGFQMKTIDTGGGISFRVICKAPNKGSVITVEGKRYTVKNWGTIYVKDPNDDGNHAHNVLDTSYTILNPLSGPQQGAEDGTGYKYIGKKAYEGRILTFGYIATTKGICEVENGYTSYIRTMQNMDRDILNTLHVKAFVEATDAEGNDVIIYSAMRSYASVAEIACYIYKNGMATNASGHNYLYDTILHKLPKSSPYYVESPIEYGWSGVVTP